MTHRTRSTSLRWLFLASAFVLISRLPFVATGYGNDRDSWQTATAARLIAETGVYHESRVPGHPVQEWTDSRLWRGGPMALNGATAVASALAALFFGLSFAELGAGGPWPAVAAIALAFTPIVYIHSVDSMDYLWALCFSMAALWLVLRDRWLGAALALGLAIGCRITAGLLLFPLVILGWQRHGWRTRRGAWLGLVLVSLLFGAALYIPRFARYGTAIDIPHFRGIPYYPGPLRLLQDLTIELWGTIGALGLALAFALGRALPRERTILPRSSDSWAELLAIALYLLAFFRLPDEAAYLIPIVPFVILLLARMARPAAFAAACASLLLSPFFFDLGRPQNAHAGDVALPQAHPVVLVRPAEGPLLVAQRERKTGMRNISGLLAAIREIRGPAVVICATWIQELEEMSRGTLPQGVRLVPYYLHAAEIDSVRRAGGTVYYVRGAETGSLFYYHEDLDSLGALPLSYVPTR